MTRYNDILNGIKESVQSNKSNIFPENEYQEDRLNLISENEEESPEMEMNEYKQDFYEMSLGSIKSIMIHAANIIKALEDPDVKNNLTESWLQGKIAITEDYMITIHNFVMFGNSETDTEGSESEAADRPGLWENIRKKKEREGKKYKPAKPGDPDRPDPKQWKKLTK
jgi:hypothetical protein